MDQIDDWNIASDLFLKTTGFGQIVLKTTGFAPKVQGFVRIPFLKLQDENYRI